MLSRIIAAPFIIFLAYFGYKIFTNAEVYADPIWIGGFISCIIGLVVVFILSPQIDWWYAKRNPPILDAGIVKLLSTRFAFYQSLSAKEKYRFNSRVALYLQANEYMAQGEKEVPFDVQAIIAINVVHLTFYRKDFLLHPFERIVVYPSPFPSMQIQSWHTSELHEEDGVLLFSAEHVVTSFFEKNKYFNVALYEYAKAFRICNPDVQLPSAPANLWALTQQFGDLDQDKILAFLGLDESIVDQQALMITLYRNFPTIFQKICATEFKQLEAVFNNQQEELPIVDLNA